jgi:hypothetical protein
VARDDIICRRKYHRMRGEPHWCYIRPALCGLAAANGRRFQKNKT